MKQNVELKTLKIKKRWHRLTSNVEQHLVAHGQRRELRVGGRAHQTQTVHGARGGEQNPRHRAVEVMVRLGGMLGEMLWEMLGRN